MSSSCVKSSASILGWGRFGSLDIPPDMLALFADSPAVSPDYDASPAAAVVLPSPPLLLTHGITQSATTSTLADIRRMMVQVLSQLNVASPAAVVVPPSPVAVII